MAGGDRRAREGTVTLHSSWRGILLSVAGAGLVAAAGTYGVLAVGFRAIPAVLFVLGWFFVLAMLFDYPIAATFSPEGVQRRMVLRRQWFDWSDAMQLTRTRPTFIRVDRRLEHGGLTLRRGRRRYLLVDRLESAGEYDELIDVVEVDGTPGEGMGISTLPRPNVEVPPTWLYRRSSWRPDWATRR